MTLPWNADRTITPDLVRRLIEKHMPELTPASVVLEAEGWDNCAFRVNDRYLFRFPRRKIAVELLESEWGLLPLISPWLPLSIPVPLWRGQPSVEFDRPFLGYEWIEGTTACRAVLSDNERIATASILGRFLRKLHDLPINKLAGTGVPHDTMGRLEHGRRISNAKSHLKQLEQCGLIEDRAHWLGQLEQIDASLPILTETLVHGDLYARHLVLNHDRTLIGIIDWGDVHLGDPAVDLAIVYTFLPASGRAIFEKHYGSMDHRCKRWAAFRALYHTATVLVYAHGVDDQVLVRECLRAFKFMRLDQP